MNLFERIGVGLKAWFDAWFIEGAAERIGPAVCSSSAPPEPAAPPAAEAPSRKETPVSDPSGARSEALTLLEVLQREARLIDFFQEDLSGYEDAQIGAAARDVHRDSARVLQRIFALEPVMVQDEGTSVELQPDQAGQTRLVGNIREGVTRGTLVHAGWKATRAELPDWSGTASAKWIVAPAEIEV